mgnify:CR=1 FL=1
MKSCRYPTALYIARDLFHLRRLVRGGVHNSCEDRSHKHRIIAVWRLREGIAWDKMLDVNENK